MKKYEDLETSLLESAVKQRLEWKDSFLEKCFHRFSQRSNKGDLKPSLKYEVSDNGWNFMHDVSSGLKFTDELYKYAKYKKLDTDLIEEIRAYKKAYNTIKTHTKTLVRDHCQSTFDVWERDNPEFIENFNERIHPFYRYKPEQYKPTEK